MGGGLALWLDCASFVKGGKKFADSFSRLGCEVGEAGGDLGK